MNRRSLLLSVAALSLAGKAATAAIPASTWHVLAKKRIAPTAETALLRLPAGTVFTGPAALYAEGCGIWIHEVEAADANGARRTIRINRHLPPRGTLGLPDFGFPARQVNVKVGLLPFEGKPVSLALLARPAGLRAAA